MDIFGTKYFLEIHPKYTGWEGVTVRFIFRRNQSAVGNKSNFGQKKRRNRNMEKENKILKKKVQRLEKGNELYAKGNIGLWNSIETRKLINIDWY